MTKFLLFLGALGMVRESLAKPGDPFDLVQEGIRYHCVSEPVDPGGILACVDMAYAGPFSREEAIALCAGATSTAPAVCAFQAYAGPFTKIQSLLLCTHAVSAGPAECAAKAYSGPFSKDESVTLCQERGSVANAECAVRAYAGPYTKEEAIKLCRSSAGLVNRALISLHGENVLGFVSVLNRAMRKAELRNELPLK